MAKIFDVDFRTGSLVDKVSNTLLTNTNGEIVKTEKGLAWKGNGSSTRINFGSVINLGTVFTITIAFKLKTFIEQSILGSAATVDSGNRLSVYNRDIYEMRIAGANYTLTGSGISFKTNNWYFITVTRNGSSATLYAYDINGTVYSKTIACGSNNFSVDQIGTYNSGSYIYSGYVSNTEFYNHVFTEQERSQAYKDFLNSFPIEDCKTPDYQAMKPTDLSMEKNNTLGSELIINGTFDSASDWSLDADWVINNGKAHYSGNGTSRYIQQTEVLTSGKKYRFSFNISNCASQGKLIIADQAGNSIGVSWALYGNGSYYIDFTSTATTTSIRIYAGNATAVTYSLDNVSIKELTGLVAAYNFIPNGNTLVDISGNGKNATLVGNVVSCKEGLQTKADSVSTISIASGIGDLMKPSTVFHRIKITSAITNSYLYQISGGGYCNILNVNTIRFRSSGGSSTVDTVLDVSLPSNRFVNLAFVSDGIRIYFYVDGVLQTNSCLISSLSAGVLNITGFFTRGTGSYVSTPNISEDFKAYNRTLTAQEIKNWHNSFAKRITLQESFKDEGADGVSKVPSGWNKVSGAWKIGEHQTSLATAYTSDFSAGANSWVNGNNSLPEGNIDGVSDGTTSKDDCLRITCTLTGGTPRAQRAQVLTVGKRYKVSFEYYIPTAMTMTGFRFYSGNITENLFTVSAKGSWQTTNQEITIVATPSSAIFQLNLVVAATGDYAYIKNFKIQEIPPLPTFTNGTKYLECVTAGIIAIPSKQAYGTWEFDWYKGADSNALLIYLINSNTKVPDSAIGAYRVYYTSAEKFEFSKHNLATPSTLISTAAAYLNINNWYRIKITRSLAGVWTAYIKGGNNTWVTISVVGGSGTNPVTDNTYTTSEYILVQSTGAGDRVTNFVLKEGIEV